MSIAVEIAAIQDGLPKEISAALPLGGKLISVILSTGGDAGSIGDAIASVTAQTYQDWELIIIDDGSTEDMADIVGPYLTDPRIRCWKQAAKNAAAARNAGIEHSRGRLIAYLDSGKAYTPRYLSAMAAAFLRGKVRCAYAAMLQENAGSGAGPVRFSPFSREALVQENFIDLNVFMHRRRLFTLHGGFDEALERVADWDLILRYTEENPAHPVPIIGACNRIDASAGSRAQESFEDGLLLRPAEILPAREPSRPVRVLYGLPARNPRIEIDIETEFLAMRGLGVDVELWTPARSALPGLAPRHGNALEAAMAAGKPDILHVHGTAQAALFAGMPIPITVRATGEAITFEGLRDLFQDKNVYSVYVSPEQQRKFPQFTGLRALNPAFNAARFTPSMGKSSQLVFCAATAGLGKDFSLFLGISKLLPAHLCVLALLETGGESCLKETLALRSQLQAPAYILPNLPHAQVADWMARAAIYLHAGSEDADIPLAMVEAAAAGCHIFVPSGSHLAARLGEAGTGFDSAEDAASRVAATLEFDAQTWAQIASRSVDWARRQCSGESDFFTLREDWTRILADAELTAPDRPIASASRATL